MLPSLLGPMRIIRYLACRIGHAERTAVAVGIMRAHDASLRDAAQPPGGLAGERHTQRRAPMVSVAPRANLARTRGAARRENGRLVGVTHADGNDAAVEIQILARRRRPKRMGPWRAQPPAVPC